MPTQQHRTYERRRGITRFIVPHPSYNWYVKYTFLGSAATAALLAGGLYWYRGVLETRMRTSGVAEELQPVVQAFIHDFFSMSLMMLAVLVVCVLILSGFLFHKVAGPVYRINAHLRKVRSTGKAEDLHLRQFDQFHDLAMLLNQAFRSVLSKDATTRTASEDVPPTHDEALPEEPAVAAAPTPAAAVQRS